VGRVFRGTPADVAMMQPFISSGLPIESGVPIGIDLKTGRVVVFDPWLLKRLGVIHSTVFMVLGTLNSGKSTLMKSLALRVGSLQAGLTETENGIEVNESRTLIHDRRKALANGRYEYEDLVDFLIGNSFRLFQPGLANIFDPKMFRPGSDTFEYDLFEVALHASEYVGGRSLQGLETNALAIGINKMVRTFSGVAMPEVLASILHRISDEDIKHYYEQQESRKVFEPLGRMLEALDPDGQLLEDERRELSSLMSQPRYIDYAGYRQAASIVGDLLDQLSSKTGGVFQGNGSLFDLFADPVVSLIYEGVNETTRGLLEIMFEIGRDKAVAYGLRELVPAIEIGDEDQKAYRSQRYLRRKLAANKEARSDITFVLSATQFMGDISGLGDMGTERRTMASGILSSTAGFFVGLQPDKPDVLQEYLDIGLSRIDTRWLTALKTGCFALIIPGRSPVFFQHVLVPTEVGIVQTNQAEGIMTSRVTFPRNLYAEAAEVYGVLRAGVD
jgi:hypothetical protein